MNLLKKFKLYYDYLTDRECRIRYSVVAVNREPAAADNVVIFHEYSCFSQERSKNISTKVYKCGHGQVVSAIRASEDYKILTVSIDRKCANEIRAIYRYFDMVIETDNTGQDFGGYFSALREVKNREWTFKYATLMNSSQFLKTKELIDFMTMEFDEGGFMGVSWGYGPKFKFRKQLHLQSFLLKYHFSSLLTVIDKVFRLEFFYNSKYRLIDKGEIELSKQSIASGLCPIIYAKGEAKPLNAASHSLFHHDHRFDLEFDE